MTLQYLCPARYHYQGWCCGVSESDQGSLEGKVIQCRRFLFRVHGSDMYLYYQRVRIWSLVLRNTHGSHGFGLVKYISTHIYNHSRFAMT